MIGRKLFGLFRKNRNYYEKADIARLIDEIAVLKSNPNYRMADVFYNTGLRHQDSADKVRNIEEYKGTILREYIEKNDGHTNQNLELLTGIVEKYISKRSSVKPRAREVAVHMRAGDVVEHRWFLENDYEKHILESGCTNCAIVTAFAFQEFAEIDRWMFNEEKLEENKRRMSVLFEKLFNNLSHVNFRIVSNRIIDEDFAFMVAADSFVMDRGRFSKLVRDVRMQKGVPNPSVNLCAIK